MSASPFNNRRDFRRVELPSFKTSVGLPPALPRSRKPARRSSVATRRLSAARFYAFFCATTMISVGVGIGIGSFIGQLSVPASVEAK
jgi:hypothetical protein